MPERRACGAEREIAWWLKLIARDICWQHCISLHVKSPLWGRQGRTWRLGEEEKGAADVADGRNNDEECFRADRCVCKTERERERKKKHAKWYPECVCMGGYANSQPCINPQLLCVCVCAPEGCLHREQTLMISESSCHAEWAI